MFKLINDPITGNVGWVLRLVDSANIPFDPANRDYDQFKKDVASGVELQDPDGATMTQKQVDEFLKTLP